ncbi:MAG: hypothetical protein HC929_09965 [Leptolyngbyaceae cyanobacterium SM2_5_2]|nr:hypothetical protein [Leptolyngbyaceae cyanobacterium SM2_5_2]
MDGLQERYLTDDQGNRIGVVLDIAVYQQLLDKLEELESLYAFDTAEASEDGAIPLEDAIAEIEAQRASSP